MCDLGCDLLLPSAALVLLVQGRQTDLEVDDSEHEVIVLSVLPPNIYKNVHVYV